MSNGYPNVMYGSHLNLIEDMQKQHMQSMNLSNGTLTPYQSSVHLPTSSYYGGGWFYDPKVLMRENSIRGNSNANLGDEDNHDVNHVMHMQRPNSNLYSTGKNQLIEGF